MEYRAAAAAAGVQAADYPLPKELYDQLLAQRAQLQNAALVAVRALVDFDERVMATAIAAEPAPAPGLGEAIRQCAPLIEAKGDWAALSMLLRERDKGVGYTELCRLIAQNAPHAPQPRKQDIIAAEWDTCRCRFPDWQPVGITYRKFRKHFAIALKAASFI